MLLEPIKSGYKTVATAVGDAISKPNWTRPDPISYSGGGLA